MGPLAWRRCALCGCNSLVCMCHALSSFSLPFCNIKFLWKVHHTSRHNFVWKIIFINSIHLVVQNLFSESSYRIPPNLNSVAVTPNHSDYLGTVYYANKGLLAASYKLYQCNTLYLQEQFILVKHLYIC